MKSGVLYIMSKIRDGATIKIRPETRDRLKAAKRGGESYDDLINRLLEFAREEDKK